MTILVTGAAGFIGMHVSRALLARGDCVIGLDNLNSYYDPSLKQRRLDELHRSGGSAFSFLPVDIAEPVELEGALGGRELEAIVHLAAQAGVRYSLENPVAYARANLLGHVNILELARSRRVGHLVYASSSSVYGGTSRLPFSVDDRTDWPLSLYAATKRADELMSEAYAHLFRLPQTGLRFFTVYGPWGRPDMSMWLFTEAIMNGTPVQLFNHGDMRRDFTYVDDIVEGVLAALGSPPPDDGAEKPGGSRAPHRIYNIGNSRSERLLDMVALLERECGKKAVRELVPMQPGDVRETHADISAISRDLGFRPRVSLNEGVPRFVTWFRNYHRI